MEFSVSEISESFEYKVTIQSSSFIFQQDFLEYMSHLNTSYSLRYLFQCDSLRFGGQSIGQPVICHCLQRNQYTLPRRLEIKVPSEVRLGGVVKKKIDYKEDGCDIWMYLFMVQYLFKSLWAVLIFLNLTMSHISNTIY